MPAFAVSGAVPARVTVRAELRPQPRRTSALGLGPRPQLVPCRTFTAPKPASVAAMPAPSTTAVQGFFSSIFDPSGMAEYNVKIQAGQDVTQPFDQARWSQHQESWRHFRHTVNTVRSRVLAQILGAVAWVTAVAVAACYLYTQGPAHIVAACHIPMAPFNLTVGTLGLLLVFRTNASYGRWDEARKMWGLMVNRTRDMNRQYAAFFPAPAKSDKRAWMQRWTVAFVYSLKCHLRERGDLQSHLKGVLRPKEMAALMASSHKPIYCLQSLSAGIRGSGTHPYIQGIMDQNLTAMEDVVGGCERLLRTSIPLAYTRHTTRFLKTWLTLLPFSLWSTCGWATIPISASIAFAMLGVEEIGVRIEEPFKILALDALCGTIAKNTLDILEDVGAWNESHSTIDLFKESVPGVGDDLSMDEKLANVVDRLEFALEE